MTRSQELGEKPIGQLLIKQALPASIGILTISIYTIVDTIFVGRYVGAVGIAAITVVMPISFLISSIGMAIGIGGASVISRALGADDEEHAYQTFGNQISLTLILSILFVLLGMYAKVPILSSFGAKGDILPVAIQYFDKLLLGIPFLAWAMMSNNVIRAEGKPLIAMMTMIIPAIVNLILDPIFIIYLEWGIEGAAMATTISYICSASFTALFFILKKSEIKIIPAFLKLKFKIIKEISSIGSVTLARQGTISVLTIVLNNTLFTYGGELGIATYGILNRIMMFANFPVLGITQGFLPIAGFNYGAENWDRVKKTIKTAIIYGTGVAMVIFVAVLIFVRPMASIFTTDEALIEMAVPAVTIAFLATPLITLQLVGAAYFQAIGKAMPALLLTLTKQGFCLIPLIFLLPPIFGLDGAWMAFPIADVLSAIITVYFLRKAMRGLPKEEKFITT